MLLYREAIHVPLMVKFPESRRRGETVAAPGRARRTSFRPWSQAAGPAGSARASPGGSLTAALAGRRGPGRAAHLRRDALPAPPPRLERPRVARGRPRPVHRVAASRALRHRRRSRARGTTSPPGLPPAFRSMRAELARMPRPLQPPGGSDPEQVKKLAALGYISASNADFAKKDLPAPRDRIGAVAQLKAGFGALQAGRYEEAAKVLSRAARDRARHDRRLADVRRRAA